MTTITLANPHLKAGQDDYLYHLGDSPSLTFAGLGTADDLKGMFGDTKFVCMGGSSVRMEKMANLLLEVLDVELPGFGCHLTISRRRPEAYRQDREV